MYLIHDHHRVFEIHTQNSFYAMALDDQDRLAFRAWTQRPADQKGPILSEAGSFTLRHQAAQDYNKPVDEVLGYGDECQREATLMIEIPEAHVDHHEARHLPVRDLRLRYASYRIGKPAIAYAGSPGHGRPTIARQKEDYQDEWLIITLTDPAYPFEVDLCIKAIPEHDVILRYHILRNKGTQEVTVNQAYAASLTLPPGRYQATHFCGAWGDEFKRQEQILPIGSTVLESRSLNSTGRHQPEIFLQPVGRASRTSGPTYASQLAWSGNWRINAEVHHDRSIRVHLGENPHDSRFTMVHDQAIATPLVITSFSNDGEEGVRRNLQDYHRHYTLPIHEGPRPVLYNSWEATYFDLSTEGQIKLAEKAAEVGVELFVVDDGWFGARRNEDAGLGDWVVSPEVFPNGLTPLIKRVHELGMKFGIWFEPEMLNPDSDLYRAHPDWILHFPGRPRVETRNQLILDFGNPEVVEHIKSQMDAILDQYPIDFIKWDMNRTPDAPGSMAGQSLWRTHVTRLHALMDDLLRRYPKLTIQSCSSGGARADAAMLARCCQVWTSDNTDALDRVDIQDSYAMGYPPETMECWVTHEHNHQTGRALSLDLRFASSMRGVLGIGSRLDELEPEELKQYAQWISFYKKVRPLVHHGTLHRPCLPEIDEGISVWQFTSKDASEAYVNIIFKELKPGQEAGWCVLADLDAHARYELRDPIGQVEAKASGIELMTRGFQMLENTFENRFKHLVGYNRHVRLVKTSD